MTGAQAVATDQLAVTGASAKVQTDQAAVAAAATAVANANQSLSSAEASGAVYGLSSAYTMLPAVGQIVTRGHALYGIDGKPTVLLYGSSTAWRVFKAGMSPGKDVAELNANLRALGFGSSFGRQVHVRHRDGDQGVPIDIRDGTDGGAAARIGGLRAGCRTRDECHAGRRRAGAGRLGARHHLDAAPGDDRARCVAANQREGR